MKLNRAALIIMVFFLAFISATKEGVSQYWNERVLEKSFEQMDFFLTPGHINPYGIGNFAKSTPGLLDDPLLNLIVNPAFLYADSTHKSYFYMDFRSLHNINENTYSVYPMYDYAYSSLYYPSYFMESRKEIMPVFSGAYLTRPFSKRLSGLFLGVSYQAILQDEDYYAIPQDIYKSNIGHDYAGNEMAVSDIPIVDKYSGEDKMHQSGHFLSVYSGYDVAEKLQLGVKLSKVTFEQDGAFGSKNLWENYSAQAYSSLWYRREARNQDYDHWDISTGLNFHVSPNFAVGVSGGYLWGNVVQAMTERDSSYYSYGEINTTDEWSFSNSSGSSAKNWKHDGTTRYAGFNVRMKLSSANTLNFHYKFQQQKYDILLRSNVLDTSYSNSHYQWSQNSYFNEHDYYLSDIRSGGGESSLNQHKIFAGMQWQVEKNKKLNFGVSFEYLKRATNTEEAVFSDRHFGGSYYSIYENVPESNAYYERTREQKDLYWDFNVEMKTVQIPIIFNWQVSKTVELMFGFNRKMARWKLSDMTLAIFDYQEVTSDSITTKETNFGERYTQPEEIRTEIQTTVLGGITIQPSKLFNVRFLVVPNFKNTYNGSELSDFQWWIGMNLFP